MEIFHIEANPKHTQNKGNTLKIQMLYSERDVILTTNMIPVIFTTKIDLNGALNHSLVRDELHTFESPCLMKNISTA